MFDVVAPQRATGTLTCTANFSNGETVTLGTFTYTFQTVLTNVAGHVLIGATLADSISNLMSAVNLEPFPDVKGVKYAALTQFNPHVSVLKTATTLTVKARTAGTAGNALATTETCANASFGSATLTGGTVGGQVVTGGTTTGQINVRWFGAKGDGVTDDSDAFNLAVQAAQAKSWGPGGEFTGQIIYVPGGDYLLDNTVHIDDNAGVSFLGEGKTKSNLIPSSSMQLRFMPMLHFEGNNNYRGFVKWLRITGFNGNGVVTTGIRIDGHGNQIDILENWIDTHWCAIYMHPHSDSRIVGNTFEFNAVLYDLDGSDHIIIADNTWSDNGPLGFGPGDFGPVITLTNCGHIMLQNNRFISNSGASTEFGGVIVFDTCKRCTISGNIETEITAYYAQTIVLKNCQHMKVLNNTLGKSELQTISLNTCTDVMLKGNSYYGGHTANTVDITSCDRIRLVAEDFGRQETYTTVPITSVMYDVGITNSTRVSVVGSTMSRGIVALGSTGITISSNESVSSAISGATVKLTDCQKVRHIGNNWQETDFNSVLMDGGNDFLSMGNTYAGSTSSYTACVLKTSGAISPSNVKFIGETFLDAGSPNEDLAIFQTSGGIIDGCSGDNGCRVDGSTANIIMTEDNLFPSGSVTYYATALTDPGKWLKQRRFYGGFLVDAVSSDKLGFYNAGTAGGVVQQAIPVLAAGTPPTESSVYGGAADGEAKLSDLNSLRTSYESLRGYYNDLHDRYKECIDRLKLYGLFN